MRILFLDQYGDLGGAQRCLLDLLPELETRNWPLIVAAPKGELLRRGRRYGAVEPLELPELRSIRKSMGDWYRFGLGLRGMGRSIGELIERHRPDVIYINGPRLVPVVAWLKPRIRCVFHSHHFITQGSVRRVAGLGLARLGAEVIASCRFVGRQWPEATVVYNGVEGGEYRPPATLARVGVVGRVAEEKGQAVFAEAAKMLSPNAGLRFAVVGAPLFADAAAAEYSNRLRKNAPPTVEFPGWLENPLDCVDLLVVPSIGAEATTRVVPEAWAAGIPVIASRIGGIAEIVDDNHTGFLVEPDSPRALADCVKDVLALPLERLREITLAGRRTYDERFTRTRYARDVADLLARRGER